MKWYFVLLIIAAAAVCIFILILCLDALVMSRPRKPQYTVKPPDSYLIRKPNRDAFQKGPECSGFSSAYVLRHLGVEAEGKELYRQMKQVFHTGAVAPKEVVKLLKSKGLTVHYMKGTVADLKEYVSRGIPVIALLLTREDRKWLHYVPVVGYDADNIYLADSMPENVNYDGPFYNRRLSVKEFEKLWDTRQAMLPLVKNTFIAVDNENGGSR